MDDRTAMPELTNLLLQMQSNLQAHIDRSRAEERTERQRDTAALQVQLAAIVEQQRIANGRTSKIERAHDALKIRVQRLSQRGVFGDAGQYTAKAKAALVSIGVVIAGGIAEGIHRALPKLAELFTAATSKIQQP